MHLFQLFVISVTQSNTPCRAFCHFYNPVRACSHQRATENSFLYMAHVPLHLITLLENATYDFDKTSQVSTTDLPPSLCKVAKRWLTFEARKSAKNSNSQKIQKSIVSAANHSRCTRKCSHSTRCETWPRSTTYGFHVRTKVSKQKS